MSNDVIHTHVVNLEPELNGGQALLLTTNFHHEQGEELWLSQQLELHSYGNVASISFNGRLTPERLRRLADQIEAAQLAALTKLP